MFMCFVYWPNTPTKKKTLQKKEFQKKEKTTVH